jgi:hypothetical protein
VSIAKTLPRSGTTCFLQSEQAGSSGQGIGSAISCRAAANALAARDKDFETWLPHRFDNWLDTLEKLRAYAGGVMQDRPLLPEIQVETEAELHKYWAIRDRVFDLLREADVIAARIHALRPETSPTKRPNGTRKVKPNAAGTDSRRGAGFPFLDDRPGRGTGCAARPSRSRRIPRARCCGRSPPYG